MNCAPKKCLNHFFLCLVVFSSFSCQTEKSTLRESILQRIDLFDTDHESTKIIVISEADCSKCINEKLTNFLGENGCQGAIFVGIEENSDAQLEASIKSILDEYQIPVAYINSLDLLVDLADYSQNPSTPYLAEINRRSLKIASLLE